MASHHSASMLFYLFCASFPLPLQLPAFSCTVMFQNINSELWRTVWVEGDVTQSVFTLVVLYNGQFAAMYLGGGTETKDEPGYSVTVTLHV